MSFRRFSYRLKNRMSKSLNHRPSRSSIEVSERRREEIQMNEEAAYRVTPKLWKVLITGGAGHLAQNLVVKLVEETSEQIRKDIASENTESDHIYPSRQLNRDRRPRKRSTSATNREISKRLSSYLSIVLVDLIPVDPTLLQKHVVFVEASFDNQEKMKTALENVDTVYHLAAVGMTGKYARDRKSCMDINAVGTNNLLQWSKQAGVQRFIYSSSIGVIFDGKPLIDAKEDIPYPDKFYNFYCESKAHAEINVKRASCDDFKTAILRFNGIYGPGEKRVTERVVNFMKSGIWIGICKPSGVEAMTQLSSVDNCVQGLIKADKALRQPDGPHGQVYYIMDKVPVGSFSFWTPLNQALGFGDRMIEISEPALRNMAHVSQFVADVKRTDPFISVLELDLLLVSNTFSLDRAERELGYHPFPSSMPQIIEMYATEDLTPLRRTLRKHNLFIFYAFISLLLAFVAFFIFLIFSGYASRMPDYFSQFCRLVHLQLLQILPDLNDFFTSRSAAPPVEAMSSTWF